MIVVLVVLGCAKMNPIEQSDDLSASQRRLDEACRMMVARYLCDCNIFFFLPEVGNQNQTLCRVSKLGNPRKEKGKKKRPWFQLLKSFDCIRLSLCQPLVTMVSIARVFGVDRIPTQYLLRWRGPRDELEQRSPRKLPAPAVLGNTRRADRTN